MQAIRPCLTLLHTYTRSVSSLLLSHSTLHTQIHTHEDTLSFYHAGRILLSEREICIQSFGVFPLG